jgi:hypothetical protein
MPHRKAAVLAALAALACGGGGGGGGGGTSVTALAASADGRYLVDASGTPVLIVGDAPQALAVNLSVDQADTYLNTRQGQGFNAAWVNLLCMTNTGGRADASTYDGIRPFTATLSGGVYDLRSANEPYFARVDAMVRTAAAHGITLWLDPIETGGFLPTLRTNGVVAARDYGRFLGLRYRGSPNIVWMSGNDFQTWPNAADDALVRAVAQGIREQDVNHLHTTELDYPVSSSLEDANWNGLIGINQAYTYYPTYAQLYVDWQRNPHLPNVFIEGNYEGEQLENAPHVTGAFDVRNEFWWAVLSGAGAFYGNRWTWPLDPAWSSHLHDPAADQVRYVRALLALKQWWTLVPDIDHVVATAGYGTERDTGNAQGSDYVTTARASNGSLVLSYFPVRHDLSIDMRMLRALATASWYNPSNGATTPDPGSPVPNAGTHVFTPPSPPHADGSSDWVLVLDAG